MEILPENFFQLIETDFVKLLVAFLLTFPIAYNREQATKIMGLRTFPLVAIASCSYILISNSFIESSDSGAQARIIQGLLSGIGFIGGGAILKKEDKVLGTASAASIWTTGANWYGHCLRPIRYCPLFNHYQLFHPALVNASEGKGTSVA